MFAGFLVNDFPIIYISIKSDECNDETLISYQNSMINILLRTKNEKQKIIILLDLFQCDSSTFNMSNLMKQANFYKSIMKYTTLYIQHVYILSNRTDLSFFVKIFKRFGKSDVPYKIVKNTEKIEENIYKKYNTNVKLNQFKNENIDKSQLLENYIYDNNSQSLLTVEQINLKEISSNIEEIQEENEGEEEDESCIV
jgi:hypothetical protein